MLYISTSCLIHDMVKDANDADKARNGEILILPLYMAFLLKEYQLQISEYTISVASRLMPH